MASVWQRMRSWFPTAGASGGGAGGGFHLWWKGVPTTEPIVACSVVLEVVQPPTVAALYFWALQASFLDRGRRVGGAHLGLQWYSLHPGSTAVNWGGYAQAADVTSILEGSDSPLPGIPGDRNTRTFAWGDGIPYRFTIHRGTVGWASTVTDLVTGSEVTVRELYAGGDRLGGFVMWSELFCRGDDPPTTVRWSEPEARTASGVIVRPEQLQVTFPGGPEWRRLDVVVDDVGVQQRTDVPRTLDHLTLVPPARGRS